MCANVGVELLVRVFLVDVYIVFNLFIRWPRHPDDGSSEAAQAELWFKHGGKGIDTAYDYHNQDQVGQAIRQSGLNRSDIFITTKISPHSCTKEAALQAVQEDLRELGLKVYLSNEIVSLMVFLFVILARLTT